MKESMSYEVPVQTLIYNSVVDPVTIKIENKLSMIASKPVQRATKSMALKCCELYCLYLGWKCHQTSAKTKSLGREDAVPIVSCVMAVKIVSDHSPRIKGQSLNNLPKEQIIPMEET